MNDYINRLKDWMCTTQAHPLLIAAIGIMLYITTLPYPFVFDDSALLLKNPLIKHSSTFLELFDLSNFLPEFLPRINDVDTVTSFALRPVAYITFWLNYLWGGETPTGYRMVNIVIHIANAIMFYNLLLAAIRRRLEETAVGGYLAIPLFASLLFLVHPLQTESITYIIQRFTSLGTFFYLATLLLYSLSRLSVPGKKRLMLYFASLGALILGMLTKEFTFTAPFSLIVMEIFLFRLKWRQALIKMGGHLACLPLIPTTIFTISQNMRELGLSVASATSISNFSSYSQFDYALTQLRVILSYFRLLVLPYGLNFDPDYTLFNRVTQPEIILSLLVWIVFGIAALRKLKQKERDIADDLAGFSIIWFPLLLSVSSSVVPLPDLMLEHRTYLPSLAFCTGMIAYLYTLFRNCTPIWTRRIIITGCAIIGLFSMLTVQRNQVYSSRLSLWSDTAAKSPKKARPAMALGNAYLDTGQDELAISWLKRSIQLNPDYKEPYLSLGNIYSRLGRSIEAIILYETYLESHPPGRRILSNLALAYYDSGMPEKAITCLEAALTVDPDDEMLHILIAEHLFIEGRNEEAREYLGKVKELDKANPLVNMSYLINMLELNYDTPSRHIIPHGGNARS